MPKKQHQSNLSQVRGFPDQFLISLPAIAIPGYDDAANLAGDYILSLRQTTTDSAMWRCEFAPISGFQRLVLILRRDKFGRLAMGLNLYPGPEPVHWNVDNLVSLEHEFQLELNDALLRASLQGNWPITIQAKPIYQADSREKQSVESQLNDECNCLIAGNGFVDLRILGVENNVCIDCGAFAETWRLPLTYCFWNLFIDPEDIICPSGTAYDELQVIITETNQCVVSIEVYVISGTVTYGSFWLQDIPREEFDIADVPPVPVFFWAWFDQSCTVDEPESAYALLDFIPTGIAGCNECGNIWGNCKVELVSLPVVNAACEIKVPCCACECGASAIDIPGTSCPGSCDSGDCPPTIDEPSLTVGFTLSTPDSGSGGLSSGFNYRSKPNCASGDNLIRSIIDEFVQTDGRNAYVFKCDGSTLKYVCRDLTSGEYMSLGRNKNTLHLNADGTHTETQGNYDSSLTYDYDEAGHIFRVVKRCAVPDESSLLLSSANTAIWTVAHDTGTSYVIDPFSRRITTTYDTNGNPKRIQDVYGRITTFSFNSSGLPIAKISPELCTTELAYDANDRLKTYIAPDSTRISYTYNSEGLVSGVQYPSSGRYTFNFISSILTQVVDPIGAITTVVHDAARNIKAVVNPANSRTSYQYSRELLTSIQHPLQGRTSFTYKTLAQNVRVLETELTPSGRTTHVFSGDSFTGTINPLGGRTTYIRSTGERLIGQVDPLGHRTSYIYNSAGKAVATVDPLGQRHSTTYNSLAQVQSTINPLGQRTSFTYVMGQRSSTINPLGNRSTTLYNLTNQPLVTIDPLGNRSSTVYDTGGVVKARISPTGARTTFVYSAGRLAATVNPLGYRTSLAYDQRGNKVRVQSPMGRITTWVYDALHQQVATIDPSNLRSTTLYDADSRPKVQIAPSGLRTTTLYGTCCSQPLATVSPDGTRTSFTYNAADLGIRQTAPSGGITTTVYNVNEQVVASIDPLGRRSTTVYDAASRSIADVNALGQRTTMVYDPAGQVTATVNPLGYRHSQVYDPAGRAVASINPLNQRWTSIHDAAGRGIARVDPLNRRSTTLYNPDGLAVASVNALGNRSTTVYNLGSQTIATINARGYRSSMTYNPDGQVVASQNALNYRTTNIYDSGARQAAVLDARGYRTSTIYGSGGRPVARQNALGHRWTMVYNTKGQVAATVNPLGDRTTSIYDTAGRQSATIQPLGQRSTVVYNMANQVIANIDANNHRSTLVYDAVGRQQATVSPLNYRMTHVFNAAGQTAAQIDARGSRQSFTYDAAGAQTQQIDALGRRTTLGYDVAGQQTLRLDARGYRTTYTYDAVSQITGRRYPDGSRATFTFDADGNRTLVSNGTGRTTFTYDALGLIASANNPQNKSLAYTYDAVSNRRSMQSADSGRFTYSYDAANQNTVVLNPFGERSTFSYDSNGRQTVRRLSNGTRTSTVYDANSWRTQVDNRTSAGAAMATFNYKYDSVGNPTRVVETSGDRVTWSYDADNRLLAERRSGASGYAHTFTYDASGNRTVKNADSVRTTFAYDVANQLSYSQGSGGRTTYVYDANGNQTLERSSAGSRTTTTWDYENQPTVYRLPDASRVTLAYNADNRRIQKQSSASTVKYVWDPAADAYQSELDVSNVTQAVYTTPPVQYGQVISQRRGGTSHWFHPNSLGSTVALSSSTQTITDTYLYDAWGNPLSSSGSTVNPFRWVGNVGYYFDSETGLYYIRARVYQPTIARWTSVDPLFYMLARSGLIGLGSNVGTEYYNSGPSCYEYSYSMPLNEVDPSGLESDLILSPNPLGQETSCRSKFLGFARCANKGSCKPAGNMIFHSAGTELRSGYRYYIGAAFQITFEHNANMFRSTCQCCCCSFGFVQHITEHTVLWKNGVVTGLGSVLNDGAWWSKPYYPSESKAYPCNPHVFGGNSLVMQDAPGVSVSNFFESPISIRTRGVTCAVCQSGPENGGANLRSATIYGCIEWRADVIGGWTANRKPKAKFGHRVASCSYARYIENMIIPGTKLQHLLALEVH